MSRQRFIIRDEREMLLLHRGLKMLLGTPLSMRDTMGAIRMAQKVEQYFRKEEFKRELYDRIERSSQA